jgi:hypothetical protein
MSFDAEPNSEYEAIVATERTTICGEEKREKKE